jgi:hypothetical protein
VRLELHAEARAELRSAALWRDERRPGLRDEFIAEVSAAFARIGNARGSYPAWPARKLEPLIRMSVTPPGRLESKKDGEWVNALSLFGWFEGVPL